MGQSDQPTPESALNSVAPPSSTDEGLERVVVKGAIWTGLATLARIASAILILPILSRYLEINEFGIMQIAMPVILFLMIFNDVGLGPALVRAKNPSRQMWSTIFWTNLGLGFLMSGLILISAGLLADFFSEPDVKPIVQSLSIALLLNCTCIVPAAWLQREFKFREMTIVEVISIWIGILTAIITAMNGAGVWALVYQQLSMFTVKTAMMWYFARKVQLRFEFDIKEISDVFSFSSNLLGTRFVTFITQNAPNMIIGRLIGSAALGAYSIAYRIMIVPVQIFAYGLTSVLLPTMSQFHDDTERMRAACMRTYRLIALVTFPAMAGIAALAEPIVIFSLGEKMAPAGPVLALLAPVGAIQSILSSQGAMFMALGRADVLFRWAGIEMVLVIVAFSVGIKFGLIGSMQAYLVAFTIIFFPCAKALLNLIGSSLIELARYLWQPTLLSISMAILIRYFWNMEFDFLTSELAPRLAIFVALGISFYTLGLLAIDRSAFGEFNKILTAAKSR